MAAMHVELSPQLQVVYEAVRGLLAAATRDDVRCRHRIGVLIAQVKRSTEKYGTRAVEQLAEKLGTNVHTLYRCASVAECWTVEQVAEILQRETPLGQPLTWSHLVILAAVAGQKRRSELLDRAAREGLSVRRLLALIESSQVKSGQRLAALNRLVRQTERWSEEATQLQGELLAELEGAGATAGGAAPLIERAIAAQEKLQRVVHEQLVRLRAERSRLGVSVTPSVGARRRGLVLAGHR